MLVEDLCAGEDLDFSFPLLGLDVFEAVSVPQVWDPD